MSEIKTIPTNKIQELASKFFGDKSEKNFGALYEEISNVVHSVAPSIVKFDKDKLQSIVTDISLTVWKGTNANGDSIYSEDKSFLSWVYVSAKNKAIQHYKKTKTARMTYESDMSREGKDDEYNAFEAVVYGVGHYDEIDTSTDEEELFHNNSNMQVDFVKNKLKELYSGEELEISYRAIIENASPSALAEEYGINSRITVCTRNTRAKQKIAKDLKEAINLSKMKEDVSLNGRFRKRMGEYDVDCERHSGMLNGEYKKYYKSGSIKLEGNYQMNQRVGEWITYYENGKKESVVNYSSENLPFILYDRYGYKESIGNLN